MSGRRSSTPAGSRRGGRCTTTLARCGAKPLFADAASNGSIIVAGLIALSYNGNHARFYFYIYSATTNGVYFWKLPFERKCRISVRGTIGSKKCRRQSLHSNNPTSFSSVSQQN